MIDAALALYDEHRFPFTIQDVAERSGVSVRSIYRYFANVDELVRAAAATRMEALGGVIEIFDPGESPLAERLERFLQTRVTLLERVEPIRALHEIMAPTTDPGVVRVRQLVQDRLRAQFTTIFRPELERMSDQRRHHVTVAVETLMLPAAAVFRRQQLGLSRDESVAMLNDLLGVLLTTEEQPCE